MDADHRPRLFDPEAAPAAPGLAGFQPIDVWHFCISGFRQTPGHPSGIQALWSKLRRAHGNGRVAVELHQWRDDFDSLAELVWNFRRAAQAPTVYVYAYSWGAGHGFTTFAKALDRRGIAIEDAVLCDPVYKHPLRALAWLALVPGRVIRIPRNVARVHWFRQTQSLPAGHQPIADDPDRTTIYDPELLPLDHAYMDDAEAFHALACDVARAASHH